MSTWPHMSLPLSPPLPPMEARLETQLPEGDWLYEPKWDGFRCLAFKDGDSLTLQSKSGQPLERYFPEIVARLRALRAARFVLDGELVVEAGGEGSFDDLLQRIHPAESRVRRLSSQTPATLRVFDLLVDERGKELSARPLSERRTALERFARKFFGKAAGLELSPATGDAEVARKWLREGRGVDGVMAKDPALPYKSGERTGMIKVKRLRTADCVVGGYRYASRGRTLGSLLLGLYGPDGLLHHVGFAASFEAEKRLPMLAEVEALRGGEGFTGRAPGGPSRWATERSAQWEPVEPKLVCEVRYDHVTSGRFRHGAKFLRWRPDKPPKHCTFDQLGTRRKR